MNVPLKMKKTSLTTFVNNITYFSNFSCKSWFPVSAFPVAITNTWWLQWCSCLTCTSFLASGLSSFLTYPDDQLTVWGSETIPNICADLQCIWLTSHHGRFTHYIAQNKHTIKFNMHVEFAGLNLWKTSNIVPITVGIDIV